jgi:hypothetical protein
VALQIKDEVNRCFVQIAIANYQKLQGRLPLRTTLERHVDSEECINISNLVLETDYLYQSE